MKLPVYMDHHATTPVDPAVLEAMLPWFTEKFGNAASRQHRFGWVAAEAVESSRATVARALNAEPKEIIFTSGSTEANNLALKGAAEALRQKGDHVITVQTEHSSVLDVCKRLERAGFSVTYLPVDERGSINTADLAAAITPRTVLVSVMAANNEIGTIHPVAEIGRICHERGVLFHTDATQALGKIPLDVAAARIDLLSFSGHKIYGPKGIGGLYVRSANPKVRLAAQIDGGGHERGLRSGTLNVPGIVGLATALGIAVGTRAEESARVGRLRDLLLANLTSRLEGVVLNGHPSERLPNNLNVSFLHVEDNALMMSMKDVAVSTGSACSTASPEPSHVLKACLKAGLPSGRPASGRLHSAIRFGLGRTTTEEEVMYVADRVVEGVTRLRNIHNEILTPTH